MSTACLIFAWICGTYVALIIVGFPLASITVWYLRLAWKHRANLRSTIQSALSMIPFWAISAYSSHRVYSSLPDTHRDCFIVTAATRGHSGFVGPFTTIEHNGRIVRANAQLLT